MQQVRSDDPAEYLRLLGESGDGPHDIAQAALMLAALDHPGVSLIPYKTHLGEVAIAAKRALEQVTGVDAAARALAAVLSGFGYDGDRTTYDDPRNADLIGVVDRRRGLPVALGILYIHAARAGGLHASGLIAPGHFLLRITTAGADAIFDPFQGSLVGGIQAPTQAAANDANPLEPVSDSDVLLRLQNNLKVRALESGDPGRAIVFAGRMAAIAPGRAELWLELAHLNDAVGVLGAARAAYERCLVLASPGQPWHNEAALALANLKRRLN